MAQCSKCSQAYERKATSRSTECNACRAAYNRDWRAARRAAGLPYYDQAKARSRRKPVLFRDLKPAAKARLYAYQAIRDQNDPARKEKQRVRKLARHAVARGDLVRQPCEVCGAAQVEGHHDDYSKPLEVRWLCPTHHRKHHRLTASSRAADQREAA